jgi:argininosuccinate lyase
VGNLQTLLVLMKGLPLAYNRDLQEDKPPLFDSFDTVTACLEMAAPVVQGMQLNRQAISSRLNDGYLDATTLMEYLIKQGMPQRTAHHLVGDLVGRAIRAGVSLAELPMEEYQEACPELDENIYKVLGIERAVSAFVSYGSTAPSEVERQVSNWKDKLSLSSL